MQLESLFGSSKKHWAGYTKDDARNRHNAKTLKPQLNPLFDKECLTGQVGWSIEGFLSIKISLGQKKGGQVENLERTRSQRRCLKRVWRQRRRLRDRVYDWHSGFATLPKVTGPPWKLTWSVTERGIVRRGQAPYARIVTQDGLCCRKGSVHGLCGVICRSINWDFEHERGALTWPAFRTFRT